MYLQHNTKRNKNGEDYKSVLLCHKYREGGKIKTKTIANLSALPPEIVSSIGNILKSKTEETVLVKDIETTRCFDCGELFLIQYIMDKLRMNDLFDRCLPPQMVPLVKAMIIGKLTTHGSKLSVPMSKPRN